MKNKQIKQIIISFLFLCSISAYSQDYYWYKDKKINLVVDSTKLNITEKYYITFIYNIDFYNNIDEVSNANT